MVVVRDEVIDLGDEVFRAERSAADRLVSNQAEEALDQIEPGAVGRDEMHVPVRPSREPGLHSGVLLGAVVIDDAMNIQVGGDGFVDLAQEGQKLLVSMARLALGQNGAIQDVEGREQRRGAVVLVIVGTPST